MLPDQRKIESCSFNYHLLFLGYRNCSGHTAVNIGKSKIVFFGGLVDKKFLNDVTVYDTGIFFSVFYSTVCYSSFERFLDDCSKFCMSFGAVFCLGFMIGS